MVREFTKEKELYSLFPIFPMLKVFINIQISLEQGEATLYQLQFSNITQQKENDSYLRISSRTNLVEGCDSEKIPTGSLYNQFISAGDFFKIPLEEAKFVINNFPTGSDVTLNYDYLYY